MNVPDHEARAHHEHEGQSDFRYDQRISEARAWSAASYFAGLVEV
jgi:hypothetical protein